MRLPYLIAALLLIAFVPTHVDALTEISICTNLNTANEEYQLTASINNNASAICMNVTANNITLDCQGFTIDGVEGNQQGVATGYGAVPDVNQTTVKNCIIKEFRTGMSLQNNHNATIENNTVYGNTLRSLYMASSYNVTIRNNIFHSNLANSNPASGIHIEQIIAALGPLNSTLINNTVYNNTMWDYFQAYTSSTPTLGVTVINLTIGPTLVNFTAGCCLAIKNQTPLADPYGYANIGKFLNITNTHTSGEFTWTILNISYSSSDITNLDENALILARYNGTWETNTSKFSAINGSDTTLNYVFANISSLKRTYSGEGTPNEIFVLLATVNATPPLITHFNATNITASVGNSTPHSATVSWLTDRTANASINYGTTTALGTAVTNPLSLKTHNITLSGLGPQSTYYYNITSCNSIGNCTTEGPFSFSISLNYTITACSNLADNGQTYALGTDIINSAGSCMNITADNVVLDCGGYTIDGSDGSNPHIGINVTSRDNITIRNCKANDWNAGMYFIATNNSYIINNTINSSQNAMILESGSTRVFVYNNIVRNNTGQGIIGQLNAHNLTFINNTAMNNSATGFVIDQSNNSYLLNNTASYNGNGGFSLNRDINLTAINSTSSGNLTGYAGRAFTIQNTNSSLFENNTASDAISSDGFGITQSSNGNVFRNNIANGNAEAGFGVYSTIGRNSFFDNIATGNSNYGFYIDSNNSDFINNSATGTGSGYGLIAFSYNNSFYNNRVDTNYYGFYLSGGGNNRFINNTARSIVDFSILSSVNNTFMNDTAYSTYVLKLYGFYLSGATNNTITNATANSFPYYGFYFISGSNNNTLENGTANYNTRHGLEINSSHNNTVARLTANYNGKGIAILNLSSNNSVSLSTLLSNTEIGVATETTTLNTTLVNNTIRSNPTGMLLYNSTYAYILGNNITNSTKSIWLVNNNLSRLISNNVSNNNIGANLDNSYNNTIFDNSFTSNTQAIKLTSSENNTIENNTFLNNIQGVVFDPSPNNLLKGNLFRRNGNEILDDSSNTYQNNLIYLSDNSTFLRSNLADEGSLYSRLDLNLTVQLPNGTSTAYTLNSLNLYPSSTTFAYTNSSGVLIGNFTASHGGINSIFLNMSVGSNTIIASYPFLIGGDIEEITTYYLRNTNPANGQPSGLDSNSSLAGKAMLRNASSEEETSLNTTTHIFSIDENPLAINNVLINRLNHTIVYRSSGSVTAGIQNIVTPDNSTLFSTTLPTAATFTSNNTSFAVNWTMNSPDKWTKISYKLIGGGIIWKTNSTHASTASIQYKYAASAPKVFNITSGAKVISSASNSTNYVSLAIDGESAANFTVQLPSSSTYTIYYDNATCSSPTCNATQSGNNATVSVALGSVHIVEFVIPATATTTTTITSSGISSAATQGNVVQSSGTPTVDEQASTTSVPPSSVPARPGEYTISEDGAVILLEGNLTSGNETTPGTVYIVGYPQSPFIVGGIVKSDPLKYGSLPQRFGFTTKAFTSYDIEIKSGVAYFCMNYLGFENPQSVTVFEFTNGAWRELPRDRFANNLTTSTACGTVKGTPYMVAGFVAGAAPTVVAPIQLPTITNLPLAVFVLGALAAVAYFAYRYRNRKK